MSFAVVNAYFRPDYLTKWNRPHTFLSTANICERSTLPQCKEFLVCLATWRWKQSPSRSRHFVVFFTIVKRFRVATNRREILKSERKRSVSSLAALTRFAVFILERERCGAVESVNRKKLTCSWPWT